MPRISFENLLVKFIPFLFKHHSFIFRNFFRLYHSFLKKLCQKAFAFL
nr:MAG TPA: hypothetical protein [Caudoviricetes sp.]